MVERDVVLFPDERLKQACLPVDASNGIPDAALRVAKDLLDTMSLFKGCVGIAAPQIGELIRVCVIDVTGHKRANSCHGKQVLIDPVVLSSSGSVVMREGCLSIPDFTGNVRRAEEVTVEAYDLNGEKVRLECDAYEARVVLHELDHLDGLLFFDRVQSARDIFPRKKYK